MLCYLSFRSLNWCEESQPQLLSDSLSGTLNGWVGIFLGLLSSPNRQLDALRFHSVRILGELFRHMKTLALPFAHQLLPVLWKLLIQSAKAYLDLRVFSEDSQ